MDYQTARAEFINSKNLSNRFFNFKKFIIILDQLDSSNKLTEETKEYNLEELPHLTAAYIIVGTLHTWDYWKDYESNLKEKKRIFAVDKIQELALMLEIPPPHDGLKDRKKSWQGILKLAGQL